MEENKNKKLLEEFVEYCNKHPEQRFWQALRNWSGFYHLYGNKFISEDTGYFVDTFYFENKND